LCNSLLIKFVFGIQADRNFRLAFLHVRYKLAAALPENASLFPPA